MKKTIFLFAFLSVSLFASANEVGTKTLIPNQIKEINTKEVSLSEEDGDSELLVDFCITRTNYWFVESGYDMQGYYEIYDVETTTTCY